MFRGMSDGVLACHFCHLSSPPYFSWPSLSSRFAAPVMTCTPQVTADSDPTPAHGKQGSGGSGGLGVNAHRDGPAPSALSRQAVTHTHLHHQER